jgi:hypothetical protein
MLSKAERRIIAHKQKDVNDSYRRKVKSKAFSKAKKAVDDLTLLATEFPEDSLERIFSPEKTTGLLEALLKAELAFSESQRLPPSLGRKRPPGGRRWVRLAGVGRRSDGGLLRKPGRRRRLVLASAILRAVHRCLAQLTPLSPKHVVWLKRRNGDVTLSISRCKVLGEETCRCSFQSGKVEEVEQWLLGFPLKTRDPRNLRIMVIEEEDQSRRS